MYDKTKRGKFNFLEYKEVANELKYNLEENILKVAFGNMDMDGDGYVSYE